MVDSLPAQIDRTAQAVRTAETLPEDLLMLDSTDAEVRVLSAIARRKVRSIFVPTCGGEKLLQDVGNVRNIYKPNAWADIHPHIRGVAFSQMIAFWQRRFQSCHRDRPYQMVIEIPFPYGTSYKTSLIVDIDTRGFSIISPFKTYLPAPSVNPFVR